MSSNTLYTYKVGGHEYMFVCRSRSTRSGFAHDCELIRDNLYSLGEATCHYLNRTWESFRYQSAMKSVVRTNLMACEEHARQQYKVEHGISRITTKHREPLEAYLAAQRVDNPKWAELLLLHEAIENPPCRC